MNLIDIPKFIKEYITKRQKSIFLSDIKSNNNYLSNEIKNKSILVIGGAGTIGSSFIKEVLKFKPTKLYVVDTNENGLTELTRELRSNLNQFIPVEYKTYPMDFGSSIFKKMYLDNSPFQVVANFAAHKHVRSEKDKYSIEAMIENNVFKAKEFLDLLLINKPKHFFCVSTDKAANPVNIMGASKKLMEELIMSYSNDLKITTARFANVAFSNGSLLAGYIERFFKKQPLSCPSDVRRFFVSPEESGQICMLACFIGKTGEIFFPKLDEKDLVNFKTVTEDLFKYLKRELIECKSEEEAKLYSIDKNSPYPVYFFKSDTSGEKLFEEFYNKFDKVDLTTHSSLGVIKNIDIISKEIINSRIIKLKNLFNSDNYNKAKIVDVLKNYLPNFDHVETGKNLDQKM
jgi:FlaA1/EpsC-like NDP-sugar epimerase